MSLSTKIERLDTHIKFESGVPRRCTQDLLIPRDLLKNQHLEQNSNFNSNLCHRSQMKIDYKISIIVVVFLFLTTNVLEYV